MTFLTFRLQVRKEIERGSIRQGSPGGGEYGGGGRLDIKDLPWEDKERVLRLVFAKINNQAQQKTFSNLPEHPLEAQQQEKQLAPYTSAGPAALE